MAETKNQEEPTFPTKRKPDLSSEDGEEHPKKAQKLETLVSNSSPPLDINEGCEANLKSKSNLEVTNSQCSSITEETIEKDGSNAVAKEGDNEDSEEDNALDVDDEDDDEDDDVEPNGKAVVDIKGKGKLIEEDDDSDDDDDDSSDDEGVSDGDSDLSDDPLAEVDLNNILPSRTRRRMIHPGVCFANDLGNEDEEDDSDDNDAQV